MQARREAVLSSRIEGTQRWQKHGRGPLARGACGPRSGDPGRRGPGRDTGLIFAAGRAVPQKNLELMAFIAPHLEPRLRIEVALGHGDPRHAMNITALLASAARTTVLPWLSAGQVAERLGTAAVLVVPSAFEPLGLIAAEAFAAGCAVVASAVDGLSELVSPPAGIAVDWRNDLASLGRAFAQAINAVTADESAALTIERAQRARLRGYAADAFRRELVAVGDRLAHGMW